VRPLPLASRKTLTLFFAAWQRQSGNNSSFLFCLFISTTNNDGSFIRLLLILDLCLLYREHSKKTSYIRILNIYTHLYVFMFIFIFILMFGVYVSIHVYVYGHSSVCVHIYIYVHVYVSIPAFVYSDISFYYHIYIYIHVYVYV